MSSQSTGDDGTLAGLERRSSKKRTIVAVTVVALVLAGGAAGYLLADDGPAAQATPTPSAVATSGGTPSSSPSDPGGSDSPAIAVSQPEPPPGAAAPGAVFRNVTYCNNEGVDVELDFFRPEISTPTPLLIYVHGGGWSSGNQSQIEGRAVFQPLLDSGYSIASVGYRKSPEYAFPAHIIDVKCAVRHLRFHAADYGIDPESIGVMGFSAGAHLAMLLGVADPSAGFDVGQYDGVSSAVRAVIEIDGPSDITGLSGLPPELASGVFSDSTEVMIQASPVRYIDGDDPPFLIIHGQIDETVPVEQAHMLDELLSQVGVEHSTIIIPSGGHRMPTEPEYIAAMIDFLNLHLT